MLPIINLSKFNLVLISVVALQEEVLQDVTWNSQEQVWLLARPWLRLLTSPAFVLAELMMNLQSASPVVLSRGITRLESLLTNLMLTSSSNPVTPYGDE